MEKLYRLEFSKKNQSFRLNDITSVTKVKGWIVVCEYCSLYEFKVFKSFIDRNKKNKLKKKFVFKCLHKAIFCILVSHNLV